MAPLFASDRVNIHGPGAGAIGFDMAPTDRLTGFHFEGTVERRLIASHPVDPDELRSKVPEDADLCLHGGRAWVSACFVQMAHMRPAGLPRSAGVRFRYLVHRTKARIPFPDGTKREAVYVLEANAAPTVPAMLGRVLGGAPFKPARIGFLDGEAPRVWMERGGKTLYDASYTPMTMPSRHFRDVAEADRFLLGMSFGSNRSGGRWSLFPETHAPWQATVLAVATRRYGLLGPDRAEADHAITMRDVPHWFGRPVRFTVAAPGAP